jgi:hypothetical protein
MVLLFGTGLPLDDIKWIFFFAILALTFLQFILNPEASMPTVIDKKVFGFPVCESAYCVAPSMAEITQASTTLAVFNAPSDLARLTNAIIGGLTAILVLFKTLTSIMFLAIPLDWLMRYFRFWGVAPTW